MRRISVQLLSFNGTDIHKLDELEELDRICYGAIVYQKLWDKYQLSSILTGFIKDKKFQYKSGNNESYLKVSFMK